ncbi:hypothetical protein GALMADRAFT_237101 [Galerina marginata CBS 339.88]|uniref:Uncharacterized protein n=1 Tax=Galerina marginata (strain CBS 339.88) TaxID=685588 RepID=A0A067TZ24_GALM3|nr:hypothetical protein GALMADRAFT_237101 [Galerina marginata CBS 339.88]
MGTRGLLGFIIRAQRHASYNHFDSYPSGLGQDIAEFILGLSPEEYDTMARLVNEIIWVDPDSTPSPELQERYQKAGFINLRAGMQRPSDWNCLLDKTQGAAALPAIKSGELQHMPESMDFLKDGLFCEWAYFIDFENRKLETWRGGKMVNEVTFEKLVEVGKGYMGKWRG